VIYRDVWKKMVDGFNKGMRDNVSSVGKKFSKASVQIKDAPTEDVAPVVHAKWIEEEEPCEIVFITPDGKATTELYIEVKCSNCKRYTGYVYSHYLVCQNEYCQHCGAIMDEKEGKE